MSNKALSNLKIFDDISQDECEELLSLADRVEARPGEKLITQGEQKQNLWFILEGSCEVSRRTDSGCQLKLAELGPMTHFGEMSFFHAAENSADVVAVTDMKLLKLARKDFDKLCAAGYPVAQKLVLNCLRTLAERLRKTDQWITELVCQEDHKPTPSEWTAFRELIFNGE